MSLLALLVCTGGAIRFDRDAICTVTGFTPDQLDAHYRLGHFIVIDGMIVSVK